METNLGLLFTLAVNLFCWFLLAPYSMHPIKICVMSAVEVLSERRWRTGNPLR
jgi:hypothetical protein